MKSVPRVKALNALLNECNFPSMCIHSAMDQKERINVYSQFKENKVGAAVELLSPFCLTSSPVL